MAVRRSREDWAGVLAKFEASGETLARFCAKRRIRARTLTWWRWRLRGEAHARPEAESVRLVAVDLQTPVAPMPLDRAVYVRVADVDVRIEVGTDVAYVADLVGALRSRC